MNPWLYDRWFKVIMIWVALSWIQEVVQVHSPTSYGGAIHRVECHHMHQIYLLLFRFLWFDFSLFLFAGVLFPGFIVFHPRYFIWLPSIIKHWVSFRTCWLLTGHLWCWCIGSAQATKCSGHGWWLWYGQWCILSNSFQNSANRRFRSTRWSLSASFWSISLESWGPLGSVCTSSGGTPTRNLHFG